MFDNEKLVDETENVEETTEETTTEEKGKYYTDEELERLVNDRANEAADRRVARKMKKYEKEMAKYRDTENVLKSQIGGENIDEVNRNLRDLYIKDGVQLPDEYQYQDDKDIERLAIGDVEDIIDEGEQTALDEVNRLAKIGYDNLNRRDQITFMKLAEHCTEKKNEEELLKLGASKDLLQDKDFKEFRSNFKDTTPIKKIYEMYSARNDVSINSAGSLRNGSTVNTDRDFTDEEISKLTMDDLADDKVWEKVRASMTRKK